MKVITWREMFNIEGDVVWAYYNSEDFPSEVFIQYNHDGYHRVVEESFPLLLPDFEGCVDFYDTLEKFNIEKKGAVSELETTGDVYSREDEETLIIVYDKKDIDKWIDKLKSLNINY